jgi:sugar phosphate permease
MSAVSGYLIAATSWRWMFIVEGLPAIAWAFVFRALVDDHPHDAGWLEEVEKRDIESRLQSEQRSLPRVHRYWDAFKQRDVMVLSVQYALWSIGVYGFVFWLPTIIKLGSKQGIGNTGALSAVPYALAVILMIVASHISDTSARRKIFVWPLLLIGAAAFYGSYLIGNSSFPVSYVLLILAAGVMYAPYGPYFAYISETLPQNVSGAAMALVNSFGALGGFAGAYVVGYLVGTPGGKGTAFLFMASSLAAAALLMLLVAGVTSRRTERPGTVPVQPDTRAG